MALPAATIRRLSASRWTLLWVCAWAVQSVAADAGEQASVAPLPAAIAAPPLPTLILDPSDAHRLDLDLRDNFKLRFLIPQEPGSDAFAATSGVWTPLKSVALSAGYGVTEQLRLGGCPDPLACLQVVGRGSTIETYSLGAEWRMSERFSLAMDYLSRHADTPQVAAAPPWIGARINAFGNHASALNLGNAEALDISLTCDIDAGQWGDLELGLQVSRVVNQGIEFRGQTSDAPLTSAAFGLGWQRGAFRGDVTSRYLDVVGQPDDAIGWTSLDVNFAWRMPWNASVSVGARNVLNNPAPPANNLSAAEMENFFGRVPYVRYQQDL